MEFEAGVSLGAIAPALQPTFIGPVIKALLVEGMSDRFRAVARAMAALPPEDRRAQRSGLIMAAIYRALLAEIERDGFQVLRQRTSLTPLRKLWVAWKTWLAA